MHSCITKSLAIFGSTGSIGCNTLDVVKQHSDLFRVSYLTTHSNAKLLCEQILEFAPRAVAVIDAAAADEVERECGDKTRVLRGEEGLLEIAEHGNFDTLVSALVGFAGLLPTIKAIEYGKTIALANKETLVVAGELIDGLLKDNNVPLIPIDSEHSAILQCIVGEPEEQIQSIVLTASGGPFRGRSRDELQSVTVKEALNHPNWKMGSKITIDSATLMNKGLEVIEAKWLFGLHTGQIDVVVHPQSIIHSMVVFSDGSMKAQLGYPDMRLPIRYALSYPDRIPAEVEPFDFPAATLTFEKPDRETFRCLDLAFKSLEAGGTAPAVLNAANEIAVQAFLDGRIGFLDISSIINDALDSIAVTQLDSIPTVVETDKRTREFTSSRIRS